MTVKELIEKLNKFDGSMQVLVDGYEGDFEEPTEPYGLFVTKTENNPDYYGDWEYQKNSDGKGAYAVIMSRTRESLSDPVKRNIDDWDEEWKEGGQG